MTTDLSDSSWQWLQVDNIRTFHNNALAVKISQIDHPEDAARWTNGGIAVCRDSLPLLAAADEYYWCDLIGLRALDMNDLPLGEVVGLMRTGAGDILRILPADSGVEILTPFVDDYVRDVDCEGGTIYLNWRREW